MTQTPPVSSNAVTSAVARAIGMTAALYGYPLLEMLRTCKNQTRSRFDSVQLGRATVDALHHSWAPPLDRGSAARCNGLLYTTAWLCPGEGARQVTFVATPGLGPVDSMLTFHDMSGEVIAEIGASALPPGGVVLLGPKQQARHQGTDFLLLRCPTSLVWMIGRTLIEPGRASEMMQAGTRPPWLRLVGAEGTMLGRRPAVIDLWQGDRSDPFVDLVHRREPVEPLAEAFYGNLCRVLVEAPLRWDDRHLMRIFRLVGLMPRVALDWHGLGTPRRTGLMQGFEDAARAVFGGALASPNGPLPRNTVRHRRLERAIRARRGIGLHFLDDVSGAERLQPAS